MKNLLIVFVWPLLAQATVTQQKITQCLSMPGYFFCTPFDDASLNSTIPGYGYCCLASPTVTDSVCNSTSLCSNVSTGSLMSQSQKTAFMTFYPSLQTNHTSMCGGPLTYTADLAEKQSVKITIPSPNYACEYRVSAPQLKYRSSGKIQIWIEQTNQAYVYIYSGNARYNLTSLIQGNNTAAVGAPYSVQVDDGAVILAYVVYVAATTTAAANTNGSFSFSYQI